MTFLFQWNILDDCSTVIRSNQGCDTDNFQHIWGHLLLTWINFNPNMDE